jgi:hypothetical protein
MRCYVRVHDGSASLRCMDRHGVSDIIWLGVHHQAGIKRWQLLDMVGRCYDPSAGRFRVDCLGTVLPSLGYAHTKSLASIWFVVITVMGAIVICF